MIDKSTAKLWLQFYNLPREPYLIYLWLDAIRDWLEIPNITNLTSIDQATPWWKRNTEVYMLARQLGVSSTECIKLLDEILDEKSPD